jgi:hypothetical protein
MSRTSIAQALSLVVDWISLVWTIAAVLAATVLILAAIAWSIWQASGLGAGR